MHNFSELELIPLIDSPLKNNFMMVEPINYVMTQCRYLWMEIILDYSIFNADTKNRILKFF